MNLQILHIYIVYCRKLYNLFVRYLKTGKKENTWWAFLACLAASANDCLPTMNFHCVYHAISRNPKLLPKFYWKTSESFLIVIHHFDCLVLCREHVTFWGDNDNDGLLDEHAELNCYNSSSLKQQSLHFEILSIFPLSDQRVLIWDVAMKHAPRSCAPGTLFWNYSIFN